MLFSVVHSVLVVIQYIMEYCTCIKLKMARWKLQTERRGLRPFNARDAIGLVCTACSRVSVCHSCVYLYYCLLRAVRQCRRYCMLLLYVVVNCCEVACSAVLLKNCLS